MVPNSSLLSQRAQHIQEINADVRLAILLTPRPFSSLTTALPKLPTAVSPALSPTTSIVSSPDINVDHLAHPALCRHLPLLYSQKDEAWSEKAGSHYHQVSQLHLCSPSCSWFHSQAHRYLCGHQRLQRPTQVHLRLQSFWPGRRLWLHGHGPVGRFITWKRA